MCHQRWHMHGQIFVSCLPVLLVLLSLLAWVTAPGLLATGGFPLSTDQELLSVSVQCILLQMRNPALPISPFFKFLAAAPIILITLSEPIFPL